MYCSSKENKAAFDCMKQIERKWRMIDHVNDKHFNEGGALEGSLNVRA